jgi:hypothetical protein
MKIKLKTGGVTNYHPIKWPGDLFDAILEAVKNGNWETPTQFIKEAVEDKLDRIEKSGFHKHKVIRNLKGEVIAEVFFN